MQNIKKQEIRNKKVGGKRSNLGNLERFDLVEPIQKIKCPTKIYPSQIKIQFDGASKTTL